MTETSAISVMHAEVHGSGGRIEGLSAQYDIVIDFLNLPPQLKGVIIAPGGACRLRPPQR